MNLGKSLEINILRNMLVLCALHAVRCLRNTLVIFCFSRKPGRYVLKQILCAYEPLYGAESGGRRTSTVNELCKNNDRSKK